MSGSGPDEEPARQGEEPVGQQAEPDVGTSRAETIRRALEQAEDEPPSVILAVAYGGPPPADSHSSPHRIIAADGKTYWVKATAQRGLEVELIAGRLADRLKVGKRAEIIDVPAQALPADGALARLQGRVVGSLDQPDSVNGRYLDALLASGELDPGSIDVESRARVIVFQTWIGLNDEQVLIHLKTGRVYSIDHGDCLPDPGQPMRVVVAPIPGVSPDLGRDFTLLRKAIDDIQRLSDQDLVGATAGIPSGPGWSNALDRRLAIVRGLAERQEMVEEVIRTWAPPLP